MNANFSRGVIVDRVSCGREISGLNASASSVGVRQSCSNVDHSKLAPSRRVPAFSSRSATRTRISSTESSALSMATIGVTGPRGADADVEVAAPALVGVIDEFDLSGSNSNQGAVPFCGPHAQAGCGRARSRARCGGRRRSLAARAPGAPQPIGVAGIEALADERLQVVAQRLRQLRVGHADDVGLLDVARIDVVVAIGLVLAPHDEEHARLSVGIHHGAHRDVTRPLGLDASGELVEVLLFQRRAGEAADLLAKAGTQAIDVEAGYLCRGDDRAFRDDGLLIRRRLEW